MAKFDINTMRKKQGIMASPPPAKAPEQPQQQAKPKKDKPPPKPKPDKIVYACKHEEPVKQIEAHPCPKCTREARKQRGIRKRAKQADKLGITERQWVVAGVLLDPEKPLILVKCRLTGAEGKVEKFTDEEWAAASVTSRIDPQCVWTDATRVLMRADFGGWKTGANQNLSRLPDGSEYHVKYIGDTKEWVGCLEIEDPSGHPLADPMIFKGKASGVFRLLADLDGMYRQWASQQGAGDEKAIPKTS